ncbi:FCD domain-containing protein [Nitratireductor sp. GCM10026969]|uniref:FCD domain-containing protein n=1 Tax=Nitratireductor sp. GCM10026969 TaxID=3252645 RepID=UPI00361ED8F5
MECCGNNYIEDGYGLIDAKIGALRARAHDDRHVVNNSLSTHTALCEMLEKGETEAFCALLARHVDNTGRDYRA